MDAAKWQPYYVDGEQVMWRKFTDMDELFVEARDKGDAHRIADTLNALHSRVADSGVVLEGDLRVDCDESGVVTSEFQGTDLPGRILEVMDNEGHYRITLKRLGDFAATPERTDTRAE